MNKRTYKPYLKGDFKTARDWHIYHVYNDPEFIADYNASGDWPHGNYESLIEKYAIIRYDIFFFRMRQTFHLEKNSPRKGEMTVDTEKKKFILIFDIDTSKAEYLEMWSRFLTMQKFFMGEVKTKRKPPKNHQLIYAIFKARKKHTFPEIYRMATERKLPYYSGIIPDYLDEDKFEEYYNKNKPKNT